MRMFKAGWGDQQVLNDLTEFSVTMKNANTCMHPVSNHFNVNQMNIVKDKTDNKNFRTYTGSFESPMNSLYPGLLPLESQTCHFKMILPKKWDNENKKRICLHYAPTGDHGYYRRDSFLAQPLAKDYNMGSIIVENPFYGSRKPKNQTRSSTRHVTDIFSMGCSLMLEGQFLFSWLESNGYGPLGISGVSLGGHNASLTAAVWQKPLAIIPCLSWSSAAHTFSEGILSSQCYWDILQTELQSDQLLKDIHYALDKDEAEIAVILAERLLTKQTEEQRVRNESRLQTLNTSVQYLLESLKNTQLLETLRLTTIYNSFGERSRIADHEKEKAELIMRLLFDQFTNLRYYPLPVTASLNSTVVVVAKNDLYIPQPVDKDIFDIREVWPGCELRVVDGGHISAYLTNQMVGKGFRQAIKEAFDKLDVCLAEEALRKEIVENNLAFKIEGGIVK